MKLDQLISRAKRSMIIVCRSRGAQVFRKSNEHRNDLSAFIDIDSWLCYDMNSGSAHELLASSSGGCMLYTSSNNGFYYFLWT